MSPNTLPQQLTLTREQAQQLVSWSIDHAPTLRYPTEGIPEQVVTWRQLYRFAGYKTDPALRSHHLHLLCVCGLDCRLCKYREPGILWHSEAAQVEALDITNLGIELGIHAQDVVDALKRLNVLHIEWDKTKEAPF